jgi:histidine kinase/histidine kinase/DNA gyrase B/HSP90-like ATPase
LSPRSVGRPTPILDRSCGRSAQSFRARCSILVDGGTLALTAPPSGRAMQSHVSSTDLTALVHLAGFTTGIVLYAMLAVMTLRHSAGDRAGDSINRIPLAAALLGLVWNVGALAIYAQRDFGVGTPPRALSAAAFAALGFLPAVVVDSATRPITSARHRTLVIGSYALSMVAGILQAMGALRGDAPSRLALVTLTVGYAIVLILVAIGTRRRAGWSRNLTTIALAAFAVSALHLSHDSTQSDSPLVALLGHHASLPLVLVILYQDYRFAFADLFLRRALSLVLLVGVAVALHVWVALPLSAALARDQNGSLLSTGVQLALWVLTALMYPTIRRGVGEFVDSVILGRLDYRRVRDDVAVAISRADSAGEVLRKACAVLAPALGVRNLNPHEDTAAPHDLHTTIERPSGGREALDHALVYIPTNDQPRYVVEVNGLYDGRRLLSDDIALLEAFALVVGKRIDAVRVVQERFDRGMREREITQLAAEAELRALRAQLNPHFLFNALTTIGYLLKTAPDRALGTLYRLTDLLRAALRRPPGETITLGEELDLVASYLAIEHERFEDRLVTRIDVPDDLRALPVLPLLVQPLVENAVKHGISPLKRGGTVTVSAALDPVEDSRRPVSILRVTVADTGAGLDRLTLGGSGKGEGVGLRSIERRLLVHYGDRAALEVTSAPGLGTRAELRLPIEPESLPAAPPAIVAKRTEGARAAG